MISYLFQSRSPSLEKKLPKAIEQLNRKAFTKLPWQNFEHLKGVKLPKNTGDLFVIGMGGSVLGTKVLNEFFVGHHRTIFLDNVEPSFVDARTYRPYKPAFIFVSKSGETIEVLAIAKILLAKKTHAARSLVITDHPNSSLGRLAKKHRIPIILGRKEVPGRFSVLSETCLLPFLLTETFEGYSDIINLLKGAREASWHTAFSLAAQQFHYAKSGKKTAVLFSYCERMKSFADWYAQLLAESIGKSPKAGITPVSAVGVKDQHSLLQLFLDGPKDKFFIFLKHDAPKGPLSDLFNAEYEGVKMAFAKKNIPFAEIRFPELSPEVIGELLFFFELQVGFLGLLFGVNFENQPAVELSKRITKKLLKIS